MRGFETVSFGEGSQKFKGDCKRANTSLGSL